VFSSAAWIVPFGAEPAGGYKHAMRCCFAGLEAAA
jgi:hypothetical protein